MEKQLYMGNQAMGLAAIDAGVSLVSGYPGTPSSEILETVALNNPGDIHVEWSVNEKAALEVAAGAAYSGARALVTMKQVGLNVAADPLMSLAYIGVKGGLVIVVADDPGPISSQTEQDTRTFAAFAKVPVFDPSSPEEAYAQLIEAFDFSEEHQTPVLFRPTTRVCHGCSAFARGPRRVPERNLSFVKDSKWVIFPRLAQQAHRRIEARNDTLGVSFSSSRWNFIQGQSFLRSDGRRLGLAASGITYAYACEALALLRLPEVKLLKITNPFPFPKDLAAEFAEGLDEVLCLEELDPVLEKELLILTAQRKLDWTVRGKWSGDVPRAGEFCSDALLALLRPFLGLPEPAAALPESAAELKEFSESLPLPPEQTIELPQRPPVLCAGCPHRASFYAVKQAMKGQRAIFTGDIGCYTLGNAAPLNMVDTCLCMGAGITIAQGLKRVEAEAELFAFIGDSTFFASGMSGVVNALYNASPFVLVVLDNVNTAMTGNQPHPGLGRTMMRGSSAPLSIEKILEGMGVSFIQICDPFDQPAAIAAAKAAAAYCAQNTQPCALIYRAPCIAVAKPQPAFRVDAPRCTGCRRCIREIGCPAISLRTDNGHALINENLCYGCALCEGLCPTRAIGRMNSQKRRHPWLII